MDYSGFKTLLRGQSLPCAILDLDAVEANADLLVGRLERDVTLRIASKSIRVPEVFRLLLARPQFRGLLTFTAAETAFLHAQGFDDLLLAYPIGLADEARVLAELAADGAELSVAIDCEDHVRLLGAAARAAGTTLQLCLDVDMSWRPLGGRAHLGVRRSPIRTGADARRIAQAVEREGGVRLSAVLAYEAQVAGMQDTNRGTRHLDPIRRAIKRRSVPLAHRRRQEILTALAEAGCEVKLVNGGGTGSVGSTSRDPTVTEVTAGSGFLCPHLFDGYSGLPLRPAAFFALAVTRRSDPGFVTCAGGGYIASGAAGPDRLPRVHAPAGLTVLDMEGFGEAQTPFAGGDLAIGDPVICRHAKGGELAERFAQYTLVRGGNHVGTAPTYRGLGACFP